MYEWSDYWMNGWMNEWMCKVEIDVHNTAQTWSAKINWLNWMKWINEWLAQSEHIT